MMRITFYLCLFASLVVAFSCTKSGASDSSLMTIGFIQAAESPALDEVREGFLEGLSLNGYEIDKDIVVDYKNALGNQSAIGSFAREMADKRYQLVVLNGLQAIQSGIGQTGDAAVIFCGVTELRGAGLRNQLESNNRIVSGVYSAVPIKQAIEFIQSAKNDLQTVGTIQDTGDVQMRRYVAAFAESCDVLNLESVVVQARYESDIADAIQELKSKGAQAVLLLPSNFQQRYMPLIVQSALRFDLPVFSTLLTDDEHGVVATIAYDLKAAGREVANMAADMLKDDRPRKLDPVVCCEILIMVNHDAAARFGLTPMEGDR